MPVKRNVVQVNHLQSYDPNTLKDDISLIKMEQAVSFSANIQPIKLPARSQASITYANSILTVSGFGLTTANQVATSLQYTTVRGISNSECQQVYGSMIVSSILCTRGFPSPTQGSCSGDSGGNSINLH